MTAPRVPTVDDLRVKLCYICREEEPNEAGTTRTWTHPCTCTLIAHESCLLEWIRSAQGNTARAENALKCPQCGTRYELRSQKSRVLLFLSFGDRVLQRAGSVFTLAGTAAVLGVMGSGIYITLTAYGAWAVKNFLGDEVFDRILTDDPSNWPWSAFINLPLLPLSLIASRLSSSNRSTFPIIVPVMSIWPGSQVVPAWMHHETQHRDRIYIPSIFSWPPSPMIFGFLIAPVVRVTYKKLLHQFAYWLLGAKLSEFGKGSGFALQLNEAPFMIRIRANIQDENGNVIQGEDEAGRRIAGVDAGAENPVPNEDVANADDGFQDPDAANLAAAERIVEINASSLGRRIGGALLIPYISHLMGKFLFRVSRRSYVLRGILGIHHGSALLSPLFIPGGGGVRREAGEPGLSNSKYWRWLAKAVVGIWWGGARKWVGLDPVWWRNVIGLGLFVVAKDCLYLLHLWHTKREIETRKVRNRDFSGVDVKELDLKPEFFGGRGRGRGAGGGGSTAGMRGPSTGAVLAGRALRVRGWVV